MTDSRYPLAQKMMIELQNMCELRQFDPQEMVHVLSTLPRIFQIIDENVIDLNDDEKEAVMVAAGILQAPMQMLSQLEDNPDYFTTHYSPAVQDLVDKLACDAGPGSGLSPELDMADSAIKIAHAEVIIEQITLGHLADPKLLRKMKEQFDTTVVDAMILADAQQYKFAALMQKTTQYLEELINTAIRVYSPAPRPRKGRDTGPTP